MPTTKSPEQIIADFLHNLSASDSLWDNIDRTFEHENCFMQYSNDKIQNDREKAKKWFNSHLPLWGRNASKVMNSWKKANKSLVDDFCSKFDNLYQLCK